MLSTLFYIKIVIFQPPLPPSPWTGIFNATNDNTVCPQITTKDLNLSEDCLLINVFVPESVKAEKLVVPVLFFAHGGAFVRGDGINTYNPHLTTRHDIILVTFNYRLGPLGYNCLGTERIPGNAALKDYIAALRWVNSNIARFGGNPNAVTIYGLSAGSMSAHALLLSDKANGLFHQAILESGSAFSYIAFDYNRIAIPTAIALDLGFKHGDDFNELQDFLETAPAMDLINSFGNSVMNSNTHRRNDNNLCIESKLAGSEAVVTENLSYKAASHNFEKVPVLIAFNELEGMMFSVEFYDIIDTLNNDFYKFLPHDVYIPKSERKKVTNEIRAFYFGNETITNEHAYNYIVYRSDIQFFYGVYQAAMYSSYFRDNPVFLLKFTYHGGFSRPSKFPGINMASHGDIACHIMDLGEYNNVTSKDEDIRDALTELWTNFVKFRFVCQILFCYRGSMLY